MKTNQVLIRRMGNFNVAQRTEDGMFNATELLKQWNDNSGQQKQMIHFMENNSTKEFIEVLMDDINTKERNSVVLQSRGKNGGTWMQPYLFIDFAMWLNPSFKLKVIKFVSDELIKYRNDAGDSYRKMCEQIKKITENQEDIPARIAKVAEALNHIAVGRHEKMLRNQATEDQMKEYVRIEKEITMLIERGYIKSFGQLYKHLENEWRSKHQPKIFA